MQCESVLYTTVNKTSTDHNARAGFKAKPVFDEGSMCLATEKDSATPLHALKPLGNPSLCETGFIADKPTARFHYAYPLLTAKGCVIGTLCCVNDAPAALNDKQLTAIRMFAKFCIAQLELHREFQRIDSSPIDRRASLLQDIQKKISGFLPLLPSENPILNQYLEDVSSSQEMQRILSDTKDCTLVISQLGRQQSLELVMFWQMCEMYRTTPCVTLLLAAVDTFIYPEATFEVNVHQREREPILQVYKRVCKLLDQRTVKAMMEADTLCSVHILDKIQTRLFITLQSKAIELRSEPESQSPDGVKRWLRTNKMRLSRKKRRKHSTDSYT
ncbi:hypothetical protein, variant [Sphaeroforma arctica JP610]|nr:hypothetical protein, variant [Sphaeroforma arctica JP610]KNC87141.1 hypothetical protein, variant [Sphaeroforma arctica JP610]|eukprot:XP_014161044.1 hypothetical protein, variant [Sphaeroforma arctica JP610]